MKVLFMKIVLSIMFFTCFGFSQTPTNLDFINEYPFDNTDWTLDDVQNRVKYSNFIKGFIHGNEMTLEKINEMREIGFLNIDHETWERMRLVYLPAHVPGDNVKINQIILMIKKYLDENPEELSKNFDETIWMVTESFIE